MVVLYPPFARPNAGGNLQRIKSPRVTFGNGNVGQLHHWRRKTLGNGSIGQVQRCCSDSLGPHFNRKAQRWVGLTLEKRHVGDVTGASGQRWRAVRLLTSGLRLVSANANSTMGLLVAMT